MRRLLALPIALLLVVLSGGLARAAVDGRIDSVVQRGSSLTILFSATSLDAGTTLDPSSVAVTIGGVPAKAYAKPFGDVVGEGTTRTVVLALDTSGSMRGSALVGAKDAANLFVRQVPDDVRVGLVAFSDSARLVVRPTTNRSAVVAAVNSLDAAGDTALYGGVIRATRATGKSGARSVIVLSDGTNDGGSATLPQAVRAVRESGAGVDAVAFGEGGQDATRTLSRLTTAGSGQVFGARETADLATAFAATAASLDQQLVITAALPQDLPGSPTVTVNATANGIPVTDSAVTLVKRAQVDQQPGPLPGPQDVVSPGALLRQPWFIALALGLLFAGLVIVAAVAVSGPDTKEGRVTRRLSSYDLTGGTAKFAQDRSSDIARTAVELAGKVTAKRDMDQMLGLKLEAAGLPLKPAEWLLIHLGVAVGGLLLLGLLTGFQLLPLLVGAAAGFFGPYLFLATRASRRRSQFEDAVPDVLTLVAGSLAAGHSIMQAFDTVVKESTGVVKEELGRALVESRLGVPADDALEAVATRMDSQDFEWVVMAIKVNRQIGGDLAEVLRNVAAMLRERDRVRRQVHTLSAEGRLSAVILTLLPIGFAGYMFLMRPDYVGLLLTTSMGLLMTVFAVSGMLIGAFWMSRIIKIDI